MKLKQIHIFSLSITLFLSTSVVNAQYQIRASVVGGGGGVISGSTYRISSTAGQTFIGSIQSSNYRKQVGFWRPAQLLTPVEQLLDLIPLEYRLDQNYPNPFNPVTNIRFTLKERSHATLVVYNLLGQKVATLIEQELGAGEYVAQFDPNTLATGIYVYRLTTTNFVQSRRMLLLK